MTSDWGWRLPFVLQWIWIPPLFIIGWKCPQSPWWLVRQGRKDDAAASLARLNSTHHYSDEDRRNTVAMMVHTTEMERKTQSGTSYFDCFRGTDRRRTEIVMVCFAIQILS
jgi:SP family general alpha glucoside:H+ symporter-like MFS transporter